MWNLPIYNLLFSICIFIPGNSELKLVSQFNLDKNIYLTGSILPLTDSLIVITASGGLYSINPNFWLKAPDTSDIIVSYTHKAGLDNTLLSTYNYDAVKGFIIWKYSENNIEVADTVATIDSCFCYIESSENMLIVHGYKSNAYVMWEFTSDGFNEIFTLPYAPTDVQVVNKTTLLVSFFSKLLWINKETGASIFYDTKGEDILGFYLTPKDQLYISTTNGIMEVINGTPEMRIKNVKGKMSYAEGNLYVLDQDNSSITILREP